MGKIKVGVLRGGPSSEYEISLKTGEAVLKHLNRAKYESVDVLVDKAGAWHLDGICRAPEKILRGVDMIFNAMHGEYGEDGEVQRLLEAHKIPFTGSNACASALAMQKKAAKDIFSLAGILTPKALAVRRGEDIARAAAQAVRQIGLPLATKPANRGSSLGVGIAVNIYDLINGIGNALRFGDEALVEKYIDGREAACAVLENFRGENHYAFPVIEIIPPAKKQFFDYECKYGGKTREICPGRFGAETKAKIQKAAVAAHISLGCRHYSRSDFIVGRDGKIYLLELNTLPGLTAVSLMPKAAEAVGLSFPKLLDHILTLALL